MESENLSTTKRSKLKEAMDNAMATRLYNAGVIQIFFTRTNEDGFKIYPTFFYKLAFRFPLFPVFKPVIRKNAAVIRSDLKHWRF
ncbi:hypothetical protein [Planomicrobium sp. CPCC 101079]|uniref:hypothetical protein n=1 Tax=Planomicrobium sp. CPCC 101079 TaxID=2599618 RepID=UPI002107E9E8|nr:hypothetical protein [Planomicrobium sp. CPCC 101079]